MSTRTAYAEIPFDLVEVKLAHPVSRPGTVAKADAIARLSASRAPFATIVAPAGYGKTTLLARWSESDPRRFAWVAIDHRDGNPLVFLRHVTAAIHGVEPVQREVLDALSGWGGMTWSKHVHYVGRALARTGCPLVLVLDDLHLVGSPGCLDVLAALVEYVPSGSQIAIASREAPELPLGRWRAHGALEELGVADLRLDEREGDLLLRAAGVELEEAEVGTLTERTEGWPAGLYLAALSIKAGSPSGIAADAIAGDDRFVAEYFRFELLSRLEPAEAEFLTYTSVLERMSGPLCDAVLQTTRSADALRVLARTNGFLVPLDRRDEWYRYHHLFGELLHNELERGEPATVRALNRRAMEWCIANDRPEEAVGYGHAAGETDAVAGLVDALALPLHYDGRMDTVETWLAWFDEEELRRYPALAVTGAWIRVLTGRPAEAERWLSLADGATSAIPLADGSPTIAPWVAVLRSHMMPDGVDAALADAERALGELAPDSVWRSTAHLSRGVAHALLGATERATGDLTTSVEEALAAGAAEEIYLAESQLALLAARRGAWSEAARHAQAAGAQVEQGGLGDYSSSALAFAATARVALHEARRDDARAALARAHRLRPMLDHGLPWITIQVGLELVRAHLALGEASAARTIMSETEQVLGLRPGMGLLVEDARELRERVAASSEPAGAWAMSLTGAELRLLPYLATHLTFPEIAARLYISRNTAKTEAVAIYRKFGVASRSAAIERAVEVGLLDSTIYPARADITLDG